MMNILTESEHYRIYNEYENVIMEIKKSHKKIQIGDFYGDPQMAIISEDEKVCVMCVIYLQELQAWKTFHGSQTSFHGNFIVMAAGKW